MREAKASLPVFITAKNRRVRTPSLPMLQKLAKALKVPVGEFVE